VTKYVVIVEGAEGSYSAYSPDLPGVVAAGDTREETMQLMREAIALHIAGLREDGEPIPPAVSTADYVAV
jgi:predicted RNase H-like HicB family nuclease